MLVTEVAFCSEPGSGAGWGFGPNMVCKTGAPISKSTEATKIIFPVRSIYESFCLFVGTGSCPQPPQGWQRPKRFNVSQDPRNAPCRHRFPAYCEQLGSNRQMIPPASPVSKGEILAIAGAKADCVVADSFNQRARPRATAKLIAFHGGEGLPDNGGSGNQNHIYRHSQHMLMQAHAFADEPATTIADNGLAVCGW